MENPTQPSNAERLTYLLETALVIHEGIAERLNGDNKLDHTLTAHLRELDHLIAAKKLLQDSRPDKARNNGGEMAPLPDLPSPLTRGNNNSQSPKHYRPASPSSLFGSSPEPQVHKEKSHSRHNVARRSPGTTRKSKALRKMLRQPAYASWLDTPR
ncbi:hypothetical protein IL306_006258 [Fusarium sp. DS 682]|nr:hypothetical protein IL306_006258 [Fusarium sp. DS 682]